MKITGEQFNNLVDVTAFSLLGIPIPEEFKEYKFFRKGKWRVVINRQEYEVSGL